MFLTIGNDAEEPVYYLTRRAVASMGWKCSKSMLFTDVTMPNRLWVYYGGACYTCSLLVVVGPPTRPNGPRYPLDRNEFAV
jgi:hypothetical protein